MRQLFPKNIIQKPKAESAKLKAESYKLQALNSYVKAFCFKLSALGFLVTSFGTRIELLWQFILSLSKGSVQVKFFMASSLLGSFQNRWRMADGGWQKKHSLKTKVLTYSFKLVASTFLILAFSFSVQAQNPPEIDTTIAATDSANVYYDDSTDIDSEIDTTKIDSRKITAAIYFLSEDSIKSLRQSKGFEYMAYIDSLLKAREAAKKKQPQKVAQSSPSFFDFGIIKLLCWAVAIGVVAFVLYKLFLGSGGAFSSNAKNNIPQVDLDEEPDMDDLDGQLKRAVQSGNYRLATRYLFLKTLQQLSDKNAISLSSEKTNIQYSQELRGKPYAESFARLCLLYEYVWFGEFAINETQFASIQQQQQQLAKAI